MTSPPSSLDPPCNSDLEQRGWGAGGGELLSCDQAHLPSCCTGVGRRVLTECLRLRTACRLSHLFARPVPGCSTQHELTAPFHAQHMGAAHAGATLWRVSTGSGPDERCPELRCVGVLGVCGPHTPGGLGCAHTFTALHLVPFPLPPSVLLSLLEHRKHLSSPVAGVLWA